MSLEIASFISGLVETNPPGGDQRAQGDDHLRLIKKALKATFPEGARGFRFEKVAKKNTSYTVVMEDDQTLFIMDVKAAAAPGLTLTLPSEPYAGWRMWVVRDGITPGDPEETPPEPDVDSPNSVKVVPTGGTINGKDDFEIGGSYKILEFWSDGANWLVDDPTVIPSGSTDQRPDPASEGMWRYNNTLHAPEYYNGSAWIVQLPSILAPQGRLTVKSGNPIPTGETTSGTVYYTPVEGNQVPIWNGGSFDIFQFQGEMEVDISTPSYTAASIYDVYAIYHEGALKIATGLSWDNSTPGGSVRGDAKEHVRTHGILTNKEIMPMRSGETSYGSIEPNKGTYLGSVALDPTTRNVSCLTQIGKNRRWGVWNMYQRRPVILRVVDTAPNWSWTDNEFRVSHGDAGNNAKLFIGVADVVSKAEFRQRVSIFGSGSWTEVGKQATIAIGFNSEPGPSGHAPSGQIGFIWMEYVSSMAAERAFSGAASHVIYPTAGLHVVNCLERGDPGVAHELRFHGGTNDMLMQVEWSG